MQQVSVDPLVQYVRVSLRVLEMECSIMAAMVMMTSCL